MFLLLSVSAEFFNGDNSRIVPQRKTSEQCDGCWGCVGVCWGVLGRVWGAIDVPGVMNVLGAVGVLFGILHLMYQHTS